MTERFPADQPARDAALDPELSFIVQAPAGSGKTGLLTQRFLRLLANVEQPEEIVAITFTRKAAAEMRERILGAMRAARDAAEDATWTRNERRTRELALHALAADARAGWGLLENPARLRVTTIDAFNAMLTRQMPVRSGFGQPPAIADQPMELCRAAANRLLSTLDRRDVPGDALRILLAHLDNRLDELSELLATMLARRDLWLRHLEVGGLDRASLEAALEREIENVLGLLDAEVPLHVRSAIPDIAKRCLAYLAAAGRSEDTEWLTPLAEAIAPPGPHARDLATWQSCARFVLTEKGAGSLRKSGGLNVTAGFPTSNEPRIAADEKAVRDSHKAAMAEVLAALETSPIAVGLLRRVTGLPTVHYTDAQWRVLEALNAVMPHAVLALQETFRDNGEVDFPELAIRARAALGDEAAPTDLALRLDHQIRHLLVDEFQDTSHSQIDLLLRLTRDWSPGDGRSLFLVGDPMQSIYQFREAEVGHFLAVRDRGLGALDLQPLRLSANFRSQGGIVDWVNSAFASLFPARDDIATGAIAFEPSEAVKPSLDDAAVNVHAFTQHAYDAEAERVVALVQAALVDTNSASTAILVRGRAHLACILPLLRERQIPFRAVELDSLETVPLVQDLLALTRTLINPADTTALLSVLRAPWCGLDLHDLAALAGCDDLVRAIHEPLMLPAESRSRLERVVRALGAAEDARGRISLRERVERAWFMLSGPSVLREHEDLDNARLFFELLQQSETAGDLPDVNDFDARLTQLYAASDPDAGEAVQIMTLHKAKGLQFDTVIIPALDQGSGRKDRLLFHWMERPQMDGSEHVLLGPIKSPEDEEGGAIYRFIERLKEEKESLERARLLYVGITRAKRHVHLLGKARYASNGGGLSLAPPAAGSLLELLWPLPNVRSAFEALPVPAEKPLRESRAGGDSLLHRLPAGWQPPALAAGPALEVKRRGVGSDAGDELARVVYEWAGDRVRHVGTLVHHLLERIARDGLDAWKARRLDALPVEQQLLALGVPEAESVNAAAEVRRIVANVLRSPNAEWLFSRQAGMRTEWALGGIDRGERVAVSIDYSFVDVDGVRWIVDYKTSTHEGGDVGAFLEVQRRRYQGQLERYARLAHAFDGRPVKVALYFPLQDVIDSWEPELG